ncbi:MAG TPA: hypothetical protein VEU29_03075 [Actinomycetota bacterium]|nr:hypothetical protein [Actinomycetota bacterium]
MQDGSSGEEERLRPITFTGQQVGRGDGPFWIDDAELLKLLEDPAERTTVLVLGERDEDGDRISWSLQLTLSDIECELTDWERRVADANATPAGEQGNDQETAADEVEGANPEIDAAYASAIEWHKRDVETIERVVADGLRSPDRVVRNSFERITTGWTRLFVLTPTHDSRDRAVAAGLQDGYLAYIRTKYPQPATASYSRRYSSDDANVEFRQPFVANTEVPANKIRICAPSQWGAGVESPCSLEEALTHEAQHASDRLLGDPDPAPWNQFKTEYRAYFVAGFGSALDDTKPLLHVRGLRGFTARQKAIVEHILDNYPIVAQAWIENLTVPAPLQKGFRYAVRDFRGWVADLSINPLNSIRLSSFIIEIRGLKPHMTLQERKITDLMAKEVRDLDDADRVALHGAAIRRLMEQHLHPSVIRRILGPDH